MSKIRFLFFISVLFGLSMTSVSASNQVLEQANACTVITSRLDRLNCFDSLFATPVNQMLPRVIENNTPLSWQRAFNSLSEYQEGDAYHLTTEGEGEKTNAWITLLALNQTTHFPDNAKPVLLMSCIDNLSRVELALPSAIDDPRIQLSIANTEVQYWRSDDLGLLFSSGRGMPAIDMMRAMASGKMLMLRSNSPFIDGLRFDTSELSQSLGALRTRCGW